jgi:phosphoglycolate phosphatase
MKADRAAAPDQPFAWDGFAAYLFDIDGTLLNSRDAVHYNAFHSALREVFGTERRIDEVPVHGNTDIGILRAVTQLAGVGDEEFLTKLPRALAQMQQSVTRDRAQMRPELCPAVLELLAMLKQRGALLGIVSGGCEPIPWIKLEAAGLRDFFSFGAFCHADCSSRAEIFRAGAALAQSALASAKKHPAASPAPKYVSGICVLGDTPADISAARAAGLPVIAVATGIYNQEQLSRERPDLSLGCCAELFSQASAIQG